MQGQELEKAASNPIDEKPFNRKEDLQKGNMAHDGRHWYQRLHAIVFGQLIVWATRLLTGGFVDFRLTGMEHIHECLRQGRPVIFVGWHGHNFLTMGAYYAQVHKLFKGTTIMVPENKNGMVLDYFGSKVNFTVIKARSELGPSQWARATISMIKLVRSGYSAMLSPDGPDGPPYQVKPGIVTIARQTKACVIPTSAAARHGLRLSKRWDDHLIPLPFSRTIVHFGPPIDAYPSDDPRLSEEELQERIEAALNEGVRTAEQLCRAPKEGLR